jgi:hypothetical protein
LSGISPLPQTRVLEDTSKDVGGFVGDEVGDEVGATVGDEVGAAVGNEVGDAVGAEVGAAVTTFFSMYIMEPCTSSRGIVELEKAAILAAATLGLTEITISSVSS